MSKYKQAIHDAVLCSEGRDSYTSEPLDWSLLSRYDNEDSQSQGSKYKRQFALLPTVDHADPESTQTDFRICGWRTNSWKNDLTIEELRELCQKFRRAQTASLSSAALKCVERPLAKPFNYLAGRTTPTNSQH